MKTYRYIILVLLVACSHYTYSNGGKRERIYLQTDKQSYLAGELLWMKLYVADDKGVPSSFSKVGYVELVDESSAHVQVKLDVEEGIGQGWMELPSALPTGYYRLIAYTRNMRNEGEGVFFQKQIAVVNTFIIDKTRKTDTTLLASAPSVLENNVSITTEKRVYPTRSQNKFQIQGLPANIHSLSVSIAGKDIIPVPETNTIYHWINELPSLPETTLGTTFIPEYEGHIVSGKVIDMETGESTVDEVVSPLLGFVGDQVRLFGGKLDDNKSDVLFFTRRIKGMHELATATYSLSSKRYRIDVQSPFAPHAEAKLPELTLNPKWESHLADRSLGLQVLYTFTADSLNKTDTAYAHFQWKPYRSYLLDEYTRFTTMEEVVIEFIPTLRFRKIGDVRALSVLNEERTSYSVGNSLVLVDGVPVTDHELIFRYDPFMVRKIDVYRGKYPFGGQFFDGLIFFTTYNLNYAGLKVGETTQFFDYEGTQAYRPFYAPSYLNETDKKSRVPDYRHTLLWQPDVVPDGKTSLTIPFSTSDLTGEYQITVEGITEDGRIIRGTSFFEVE